MVEIPDEDGHGASGFSISKQTARYFTKQEQDTKAGSFMAEKT